jgi:hypothetical protein
MVSVVRVSGRASNDARRAEGEVDKAGSRGRVGMMDEGWFK